jgi:hypothetical protein
MCFDTNNDLIPQNVTVEILSWGDPRKKRKQIENYDEKQRKKQEYQKNRSDREFSSKWQTERPWLVFIERKKLIFSKVIKSVTPS